MRYGTNELYQIIMTPGVDNERPLTRDWMYAEKSHNGRETVRDTLAAEHTG
jgi:hypothetical protein